MLGFPGPGYLARLTGPSSYLGGVTFPSPRISFLGRPTDVFVFYRSNSALCHTAWGVGNTRFLEHGPPPPPIPLATALFHTRKFPVLFFYHIRISVLQSPLLESRPSPPLTYNRGLLPAALAATHVYTIGSFTISVRNPGEASSPFCPHPA